MAFSSWRLPKVNFDKLSKLSQSAIWRNCGRAVHGPLRARPSWEES